MATIVHFDLSAENPERAKHFYETVFNWQYKLLPGMINYYLIETADLDGVKGLGGGMAKREDHQQAGMTNFIGVSSVDESLKKIEELGGKIMRQKQAIPGFGFLAVCLDTEDNLIGLFQETKM